MAQGNAAPFRGRLQEEREAAGLTADAVATAAGIDPNWYAHIEAGRVLPTLEEFNRVLPALGGPEGSRLYDIGLLNTIGALGMGARRPGAGRERTGPQPTDPGHKFDYARFYERRIEIEHMLVSKDEQTWMEREAAPDRAVDVFVNMSCGPQEIPHLMLNTVSVLRALGISFAAAAGPITCCGTYYRNTGQAQAGYRMHDASVARRAAWGATTTVHWCTGCEMTFTEGTKRRELSGGGTPMRDVQLISYLDETLRAMGDKVPWQKPVETRVLVQRLDITRVTTVATDRVVDLLGQVPGVEVLGFVGKDGPEWLYDPQRQKPPTTPEEVRVRRAELTELARSGGADTISFQHFSPARILAPYVSDEIAIRHPVSIIAEALGCEHPDRYQAALRSGDPEVALEQLRPNWESWGMSEELARRVAVDLCDPIYAEGPTRCTCGREGGGCAERLVSVDILSGTVDVPAGAAAAATP